MEQAALLAGMVEPLGRHLVNGKQMNVHSCKQTDAHNGHYQKK